MPDSDRSERDPNLDQGLGVLVAIILCCLIVGTLAFSSGRDSERDSYRASEYQGYAERRQDIHCAGMAGPLLAKCEIEQEDAARQAYQSERDLEAQRDMSLWALAVFVIGAITAALTLWALFYVRGTLIATREALKDTGKATEAMVESNRIAREAHRPWMKIEARITKAEATDTGLNLRYEAKITNIGKIAAERAASRGGFVADDGSPRPHRAIKKMRDEAEAVASITEVGPRMPYPIVPGETKTMAGDMDISGDLSVYQSGDGDRTNYVVFICVRYHLPGEQQMREADRAFSVDYGDDPDDPFLPYGIPVPLPDDLSPKRVFLRPAGHNRTT
jgi:hypothetical protein